MNSFSVHTTKNAFIFLSFLKDIVTKYCILERQIFFFSVHERCFSAGFFLFFPFALFATRNLLLFFSLSLSIHFFSDCFQGFLFITGFDQFDYTVPLYHFLYVSVGSQLQVFIVFSKSGKCSSIISSKFFLLLSPL